MEFSATSLTGVFEIIPPRFADERGWLSETWNAARFQEAGIDLSFVQDNHSYSNDKGTLRGLHYQAPPYAQDKLVRCTRGAIIDIVVDVRKGSPTYGQWLSRELSADNGKQLFVPKGFLHGFATLLPASEVQYKVSNFYNKACEGAVRWDSLDIDWGLTTPPVLSEKDQSAPLFDTWASPFVYEPDQ